MTEKEKTFLTLSARSRPFSSHSTLSKTSATKISFIKPKPKEPQSKLLSPVPIFSNQSLQLATTNGVFKENIIRKMFKHSFGEHSKLLSHISKSTDIKNQPLVRMLLMTPKEETERRQKQLDQFKRVTPTSNIHFLKITKYVFDNNNNISNNKSKSNKQISKDKNDFLKFKTPKHNSITSKLSCFNMSYIRNKIVLKKNKYTIYSYNNKHTNTNNSTMFKSSTMKSKNSSMNSSLISTSSYLTTQNKKKYNNYNNGKYVSVCIKKKNYDIHTHLFQHMKHYSSLHNINNNNNNDNSQGNYKENSLIYFE